jgi:hypothetical protein
MCGAVGEVSIFGHSDDTSGALVCLAEDRIVLRENKWLRKVDELVNHATYLRAW